MNDDEKICPFCAETIKEAAIRCRFCQADLPQETVKSSKPHPNTYSEPAAFRVAARTQSKFSLAGFIIGLMCLFAIAIGGGYAVRPFLLAMKNPTTSSPSVLSQTAQESTSDPAFDVGSEYQVNSKSDNCLLLFGDVMAVDEYIKAKNANDQEGIDHISWDRLKWICEPVRIRVLEDDYPQLHPTLLKVRIIGGNVSYSEKKNPGWVFTSHLKRLVKS